MGKRQSANILMKFHQSFKISKWKGLIYIINKIVKTASRKKTYQTKRSPSQYVDEKNYHVKTTKLSLLLTDKVKTLRAKIWQMTNYRE